MNTLSDQMVLWVVNVLIHSTVLTAVLLCVALLFRKRAAMRYWILCCGLLLVLASPAVSALVQSNGSGWLTLALPNETVPTTASAANEQPTRINDSPMQGLPTQEVNAFITPPVPDAHRADKAANASIASERMRAANVPTKPSAATPVNSGSLMQLLKITATAATVIWALGATLLLARMATGWIRLAGILRRADLITDPDYVAVFTKACALAGCKEERTPHLLASGEVTGPLAAGILPGSVVLPKRLIDESSPIELADVLVHEVAHVVRRDQIVVLFQNIVAAIYWLHPLVGKLNRELAKAREEVCDNFVLATTDAPIYSRTLLSLAQLVQQPETVPGSVGFFTSRWKLEQRVAGLLDETRDKQTLVSKRGWALVLASAVGLLTAIYVGTVTIATAQVNDERTVKEPVESRTVQVRGQVLKPDGSPASGATVRSAAPVYGDMRGLLGERFETAMTEVVADEKGQFMITVDTKPYGDMPVLGTKWEDYWKYTVISATMPGFAGQFAKFKDVEESDDIALQLVEDTPIRGRIIGLEGQPISGVSVDIEDIWVPRADNLDAWLSAVENGEPAWTAVKHLSRQCEPRMLGVPETVTSDENGEFEINGVGRERCMAMHAHGNGIAFDSFEVVSRSIDPLPWDETGSTDSPTIVYGARFTLTGRPSRTVTGTVTDAETGLPLAGVDVAVSMMSGKNIAKLWLLPTKANEQGAFRIVGMPKGNGNQLMVRPTDDQPYFMREIDVPDPDGMDPIAIDIQLHRGIWIEGNVVDKQSREPVAGARVHYLPLLTNKFADELPEFDRGNVDGQQARYQTDAEGKYRLVGLPGPAVIGVESIHQSFQSGVGYKELTVPKDENSKRLQTYSNPIVPGPQWPDSMIQIEPDEGTKKVQLDLELVPGPEISVSVFDESGQWLSGATLVSANQRIKLQKTPVDVVNLSPEESKVIVVHHKKRGLGIVHHVTTAAIANGQLPLTARKCATITGRLVDDGKPLPGIRVRPNILPSGDFGSALPTVTTDTHGVFRTELLPGCKYRLSLEGEPFKYATFEENLEVSTAERIDLGTISLTTDRKFQRTDGSK